MADYFQEMGWSPLAEGEAPNHLLHLVRLFIDYNMFEELGETQRLPPPASIEAVNNLPEVSINEEGKQCPVCLKDYEKGSSAVKMPCDHLFHPECIKRWLTKTNSCPLCRHELPTDDENYEAYRKEKIRAKQRVNDIENLHNCMFS
ncbi:E3 ubiquitin-protein ligase RNF181-like [Agrilus planipennis]|uniref:E3 ubiquitin-protein ligase RNF181 n=1 Tax=Agrilus planipennis TaxID=224129 RepID=A0A1W4X5A9_AGRPL|nr:E3 ubiquitin-protein ligase RNF181-like [Agrilus planipennis]